MAQEFPMYFKTLEQQLKKEDTGIDLSKIGFGSIIAKPDEVSKEKKLKFMLVSTHLHQFTGYAKVGYQLVISKSFWFPKDARSSSRISPISSKCRSI